MIRLGGMIRHNDLVRYMRVLFVDFALCKLYNRQRNICICLSQLNYSGFLGPWENKVLMTMEYGNKGI